jgi:hypothetical protein
MNEHSIKNILSMMKISFERKLSEDSKETPKTIMRKVNALMSAFAMFQLKYPSMLQFDDEFKNDSTVQRNLKAIYLVDKCYTDTQLRMILDEVEPQILEDIFREIFELLGRNKILNQFEVEVPSLGRKLILAIDGTEYFKSEDINCECCCERHRRNGKISYYHQMLCGSIVSKSKKEVLSLLPEPIIKQDGYIKNDCEINAFKRYLNKIERVYPNVKFMIIADGLSSKATLIEEIKRYGHNFVLVCKPGDHKFLFEHVENSRSIMETCSNVDGKRVERYSWINSISLNRSKSECKVNFLEYTEIDQDGAVKYNNTWVTDQEITHNNVSYLKDIGRSRWKIENETFNTLKNRGYNFDHNYGHGKKNLSNLLAFIMILSFLIDQIQQITNELFKKARERFKRATRHWDKMRSMFMIIDFANIDDFYFALANKVNYSFNSS